MGGRIIPIISDNTFTKQVGNHCPFLPPYLTWYLRRPFSYCRWYGGGVGPFDHGVSCQFVVQHFEISLPSSFFCPISSYITISSNIVYLPILTGIVSVISLCSIIHKWFPWQYPELTQVRNEPWSFVFNVLLLVFLMYYLFSSLSTIIWNCKSILCTIIAYLSYHVKIQKVCNYSLSMYFTFFWYRTKIVMIYSRWNQCYPNVSYHPWSRQSSWYSPILSHTPPSFVIVKKPILSNIEIFYIDLKLRKVRLLSTIAYMIILSNIVNPSEWSRFVHIIRNCNILRLHLELWQVR